jgi:Cys-rich four helix bundle protein (predicted Tat secretion target)
MKDRRDFLMKSVGVGVGAFAASKIASQISSAFVSSASAADKGAEKNPNSALNAKLAQVASDCVRTGLACISHCQKELAAGNKTMAKCNTSTHEMVAISKAMLELSSFDSPRAMRLVPLFVDACKSCSDSCEEHKAHWSMGMHLECKACDEACIAAEKLCSTFNA